MSRVLRLLLVFCAAIFVACQESKKDVPQSAASVATAASVSEPDLQKDLAPKEAGKPIFRERKFAFLTFYHVKGGILKEVMPFEKNSRFYDPLIQPLARKGKQITGRVFLSAYSIKEAGECAYSLVMNYDIQYELEVGDRGSRHAQLIKGSKGVVAAGFGGWPDHHIGPCLDLLESLGKKLSGGKDFIAEINLPTAPAIEEGERCYW